MKFIIKLLDVTLTIFVAVMILPIFAIYVILIMLLDTSRPEMLINKTNKKYKNLLRLVPANLDDLKKKGVMWMLYDTDENEYFNHVYTVHYPAQRSQKVLLNERHTVFEIGNFLIPLKKYLNFFYIFINGSYFLWKVIKIRNFVKDNISIIRGQDPDHMGLAAFILHRLTSIPWCVSVHADHQKRYEIAKGKGVYNLFNSRPITNLIRRIVLSNSLMIMVIRESLIPYVIKCGARPEYIRVTPHGIRFDEYERNVDLDFERKWRHNNRKLVVFAGRLYPENYITDIIMIADKVRIRIPNVLFLILGDGIEREKAEVLTRKMNLMDNILFLGFQPHEKVIEFRKIADVNLCLMGGFSLIESAAAGKPIVSYDVEWHYELVKDNETGYLVKEHDINRAAETIIRLIDNPDLARRYGENAKRLVLQNYSIDKTSKRRIECYSELIG